MAEQIRILDPLKLERNPENPRLIFRAEELESLQQSISEQGILVPLTVYQDGSSFFLLDGERRWRCALKLGLRTVPAIVQPKPDRLQNLMMMFAIHNARKDWDPLPTALKLQEIDTEFAQINGRSPKESELAGLASLTRGEVRRLKKLLSLPTVYRKELLDELEKPRHLQTLTVDHVLEATRGAEALKKRSIIDEDEEEALRRSIVNKFKSRVVKNTVAPRKLARLARAVDRGEVSMKSARKVVKRLISEDSYSIEQAFQQSVEQIDFEHGIEQLTQRLLTQLGEHVDRGYKPSQRLLELLEELVSRIRAFRSR